MPKVKIYDRFDKKGDYREGWFHIFSTYADGDGSQPVAVVEYENGEVATVDPSRIVFQDRENHINKCTCLASKVLHEKWCPCANENNEEDNHVS